MTHAPEPAERDPSRRAPAGVDYSVVIPTIGRPSLLALLASLARAGEPSPREIVVVDDRRAPEAPLELPAARAPLRVVASGGRGPAAARNTGWRVADADWIAFLDDDVEVGPQWCGRLAADLAGRPAHVGASQGRLRVPLPADRQPTDDERRTARLADAPWITADMAVRRQVLEAVGGFDERFPRAFREDSDLAVRIVRAGYAIVWGQRESVHPPKRGGWWSSVRAQAGNADNALLRAKYGPQWRTVIQEPRGRFRPHLLTTAAAAAVLVAGVAGRRRPAALATGAWALLTAQFAAVRIAAGPRTAAEVATVLVTSAVIPPVAVLHRLRGEYRVRRAGVAAQQPVPADRPAKAVLFDRDGTLIHDVPYLTDATRVEPVAGAQQTVAALREAGVRVGIVSNQSGVGRGLITVEELRQVNARVDELLGPFDTWQVCLHAPEDHCACRKPRPGMVLAAARELAVDPAECVLIGDTEADVDAALTAGARAVLVPNPVTLPGEITRARRVAAVAATLPEAVTLAVGRVQ